MGATGASVRKHPAIEHITEQLLSGVSPENVSKWLKTKYPKDKRMHLSKATLQMFRKNFLNLEGDVLADIKRERREKIKKEYAAKAVQQVHATEAYQIAKVDAAEQHVLAISDTRNRMEELYLKVTERIAVMETQKISHHNDKVICEYLNLLRQTFKDFFEQERALESDKQTTVEIDIERIEGELKAIKVALRETISEVCPEAWGVFVEKLEEKMQVLQENPELSELSGQTNINIKV